MRAPSKARGSIFSSSPSWATTWRAWRASRRRADITIGCDEGVHRVDDLRRHHEARAARGASLKTVKLGGLRPVCEAAALCEELGMKVNLAGKMAESGIATAAVLHLAAAVPTLDWGVSPTSPYLTEDVLARPLQFSRGHALVPSGPGLGIDVDESEREAVTVRRLQRTVNER